MSYPTRSLGAATLLLLLSSPALAKESFTCTQVMGVSVTGDWFNAGFEQIVANEHFQAQWRKHAFVDLWADPKNELWAVPLTSPCKAKAEAPDRVLFTGVNWKFTTADEWADAFTKVVANLKARNKGLKRIELLTMLRAPGNKGCGDPRTVVAPVIDEAIARVAAAHPGLVKAGPKVEAPSCDVFTKGGPHFTPEGMGAVAKAYASHYGKKS